MVQLTNCFHPSFQVHPWVTRCVNTVLLVTSPPATLPPSLVGPTRTAPIWVSRPWGGARPRWTASVPLRTRPPCWSALITTLCATTVRPSGPRSWQGYVGEALERDLARMPWCFLDKTPNVNSFISETDWILSGISLLGMWGISSVRFASRFHTFPNSRMSEHQHRSKKQSAGMNGMFQAPLSYWPMMMTRDTGLANRTKKTHWTQKKPHKMCLDSWTLRNHRNTHVRMCRPRHTMPPRSPQHKPTAPRGRWHVHKH